MDIYQPAEDSYLLQRHLKEHAIGRVLDLGTGSGIQALTLVSFPNVREVIAVDINEKAIQALQQKISHDKLRKIKAIISDLFTEVNGQFNIIVFNPPYLPQDYASDGREISDRTIYGGKKGWEVSERFFQQVSRYLFPDGEILFLFSSLTDKLKIDELIHSSMLEKIELEREKVSFEELYIYLIKKSKLLRELEGKGIEQIRYFNHGKRGEIFVGVRDKNILVKKQLSSKQELVKIAIKVKREQSEAQERISYEAHWLPILNKQGIGPRFIFSGGQSGQEYLAYEFVEGKFITEWIADQGREAVVKMLLLVLDQCFILDRLGINKEEMHHPQKHIIIPPFGNPVLIDFERVKETDKPQNVTQFVEFICRMRQELKPKDITINPLDLRNLAQEYKNTISEKSLEMIKKNVNSG